MLFLLQTKTVRDWRKPLMVCLYDTLCVFVCGIECHGFLLVVFLCYGVLLVFLFNMFLDTYTHKFYNKKIAGIRVAWEWNMMIFIHIFSVFIIVGLWVMDKSFYLSLFFLNILLAMIWDFWIKFMIIFMSKSIDFLDFWSYTFSVNWILYVGLFLCMLNLFTVSFWDFWCSPSNVHGNY